MSDHITPQEARNMLSDLAPLFPTEEVHRDYGRMYASAPDMAEMIAGARVETRGVGQIIPGSDSPLIRTGWSEDDSKSRRPNQFPPECWRIETRLVIDLPEEKA